MTRNDSLIVQTTARLVVPFVLFASLFLLWRGHHEPGGGFIAGLVAVGGFALHGLAFGTQTARRLLRVRPQSLLGVGLAVALGSTVVGLVRGEPLATGAWIEVAGLKLGTPLLFDVGVYLTVIGFVTTLLFALEER